VRTLRCCLIVAVAVAAPLRAQGPRPYEALQVGAPIRVSGLQIPGQVVTGMFAGAVGDTVLIGVPEGIAPVRVPRRDIALLEIRLGRRPASARASLVGLAVGGVVGAAIAATQMSHGVPTSAAGFLLGGPAAGLMVGGALGLLVFRQDRWVTAPLAMLDEAIRAERAASP
jgi:hypothetical protein